MLAVYDAKQLEWRTVCHLANDKIGIAEINEGRDFHSENQTAFNLPDRLIAKIFLFRAIFKGSAYAYSVDNDFKHLGGVKFWEKVIERFYNKYTGIYYYHEKLMKEATSTGKIVSESGRVYEFEPRLRRGEYRWPENDIVNYPVN